MDAMENPGHEDIRRKDKNIKNSGFTLIELLMTFAVISILFLLSHEGWHHFYQKQYMSIQAQAIYQGMQFARSTAIMNHQTIGICGSSDMAYCSANWSQGFMIFKDLRHTNIPVLPEQIIYQTTWEKINDISSYQQPVFVFTAEGHSLTRGTVDLINRKYHQKIIVFDGGRIRRE